MCSECVNNPEKLIVLSGGNIFPRVWSRHASAVRRGKVCSLQVHVIVMLIVDTGLPVLIQVISPDPGVV